jgi:hypothetical protein
MFIRSKESKQAKMDQKKNDQHVLPVPKINPNSIIDVLPAVGMEELDQPQQNLNFVQKFGNFLLRRPGPKHEHPYRPKIHPSSTIDVLPGVGMGQFNQPQPNLYFPSKFGNYLPRRPGPKGKDPHRHLYMSAPLPGPNSKALTTIPKASDRISVQPGPNPNLPKSNAAVPKVNPNVPKFEINVPNLHSKNRKPNSDLPGPRTRRAKKESKSKINSSSEDLKTESWNTRDVIYLILLIFGVIMATAGTYKTFAMSERNQNQLAELQTGNEEKLAKLVELQTELAKLAGLQTGNEEKLAKLAELQTEVKNSMAIAENMTKLEKNIIEEMTKLKEAIKTVTEENNLQQNFNQKEKFKQEVLEGLTFEEVDFIQEVEQNQSNEDFKEENFMQVNEMVNEFDDDDFDDDDFDFDENVFFDFQNVKTENQVKSQQQPNQVKSQPMVDNFFTKDSKPKRYNKNSLDQNNKSMPYNEVLEKLNASFENQPNFNLANFDEFDQKKEVLTNTEIEVVQYYDAKDKQTFQEDKQTKDNQTEVYFNLFNTNEDKQKDVFTFEKDVKEKDVNQTEVYFNFNNEDKQDVVTFEDVKEDVNQYFNEDLFNRKFYRRKSSKRKSSKRNDRNKYY